MRIKFLWKLFVRAEMNITHHHTYECGSCTHIQLCIAADHICQDPSRCRICSSMHILDKNDQYKQAIYSVSQTPSPWGYGIFSFFHKRLRIFNRFFKHLLHVRIFARLQIFIQLYPTLTKLCHIKRDYLVLVICSKCPSSAETHAFRRLRKSLITLLIVVCGKPL